MIGRSRIYRFRLRDGHGVETVPRILTANSKADALAVIEKNKSPHQKVETLVHLGWTPIGIHSSPNHDDVAFTVKVEGKDVLIDDGESHAHLVKLFPKAVKDLRADLVEEPEPEESEGSPATR